MRQPGIVDLGIVGERDERGVVVDADRRQRHVRPFGDHLHVGKPLDAGEGRARIDDGDVIAEQLPHRRQRLADVHRAGDDELRRRHVHGEEHLAFRRLLDAALGRADMLFQHAFSGSLRDVGGLHQPLRAAVLVGDDDDAAPRRAFFVQRIENIEAQGLLHLLDEHADLAAARQPDLPGGLVGDAEFQRLAACRFRSRRWLRSPPRPRRSRPTPSPGNCPGRRSRDWSRPAGAPSPRSRPPWPAPRRARPSSSPRRL